MKLTNAETKRYAELTAKMSAPEPRRKKKVAPKKCTKPPTGWQCTRTAGHDGPCAAKPVTQKKKAGHG